MKENIQPDMLAYRLLVYILYHRWQLGGRLSAKLILTQSQ